MALKMPKLFGEPKAKLAATDADIDIPTTQVRMSPAAPSGYDPLATVSVMEQLRAATAKSVAPWKLPAIGHLPVGKQLSVLGTMLLMFLALAASSCDNVSGVGVGVGTTSRWGGPTSGPPIFVGGPSVQ